MKKIITYCIFSIVIAIGVNTSILAQEKSKKELKGDKYYKIYSFDKAIDFYTRSKDLTSDGQRKLAESYHNLNQIQLAEEAYSKLIENNQGIKPDDYFAYASVLKANEKYAESNVQMLKLNSMNPADLRAISFMENSESFSKIQSDNGTFVMSHLEINTKSQDFAPAYFQDKIVFASSRKTPGFIARKSNWNGEPFFDLYIFEYKDGQIQKPKNFSKVINTKLHDGPASFTKDNTFMAFTSNNYNEKRKDSVVHLQIYFSKLIDSEWSKPFPFYLNNNGYSVGHPVLANNGKTLYFTSDMPGGFGGSDIYSVTKTGDTTWGDLRNLGKIINTESNEMFPFFEENEKVLYFSSNGHFGLGDLDVFACPVNGLEFGKVTNVGFPLNTRFDDFAMILNMETQKGIVSSNRTDGNGGDDLYSFELLKPLDIGKKIEGIALDSKNNFIPYTQIRLLDKSGKLLDTQTATNIGEFAFLVEKDKEFKIIGSKPTYTDGESLANTNSKSFVVKCNVVLSKEELIAKKTKPSPVKPIESAKSEPEEKVVLNTIYFDLDKFEIRNDAEKELDKLILVMNKNSEMTVRVSSYADCRGTDEYNQILSRKRYESSIEYIKKRITNPERINGKGFGENNLVNDCDCEGKNENTCPEYLQQENRRTEFFIINKGSKTIAVKN